MKSDRPLDYAVFQLSPRRSRCELFVSSNGNTEKLASGLVKPFVAQLKVVEEQVASNAQSVKLKVGRQKSSKTWFTKGTLERFVQFVSTPEVLDLVNTFDAEMSQLDAARKIYAEDTGNQLSGGGTSGVTTSADATKKELLRAIDVRLVTVEQDLTTACACAASAGFNGDTVSELQMFAEFFGGHRLNKACSKYISLCERRADLISPCGTQDGAVQSSYGSDMSIDEDPSSPQPTGTHPAQTPHRGDPSTFRQPFSVQHTFSCESSIERDASNKQNDNVVGKGTKKEESSSADQTESTRMSHHVRRLSVQDRISLFENKQKETSGSGGKPAVRKSVELRRLSSDVSSAPASVERAVLRRWSGASDMSIDLNAEKKDNESPLCTPSSVSGLQSKSEEKKTLNLNDTMASSVKPGSRIIPGVDLGRVVDSGLKDNSCFSKSNDVSESLMSNPNLSATEFEGPKDQTHGKSQSRSFIVRAEDQENSEEKFKSVPDGKHEVLIGLRVQGKLKGGSLSGEVLGGVKGRVASDTQVTEVKDQGALQTQIRTFGVIGGGQIEISDWKEQYEPRDQFVTQSRSKSPQKMAGDSEQFEGLAGSRIREAFAAHYKGTERGSLSSQSSKRSTGDTDEAGKKELVSSEKIPGSSVSKVQDSGLKKMKFQRLVSAPEPINKSLRRKDESHSVYGSSGTSFSGKLMMEGQDGFDSFLTPTSEQVQRLRLSKGNQELNDELKIKANELERLFAELRLPGDQSSSACRVGSAYVQGESAASLSYTKPIGDTTLQLSDNYLSSEPTGSSKNAIKFSAAPLMTMVENQKYGDAELNFLEGTRGKLYDMYMLKRDAKLREEWGSNKAEKEAKLKTMRDRFEQNTAEMKAKFSESADRQNSVSGARRRAERLRSFNTRSSMKREQKRIDFEDSEDDEDASEFQEQEHLHGDSTWNETSFGDGVSRSAPGRKLPTKSSSTSMPHTSAAPAPRSAAKASILSSGKRRVQSENPLVQTAHNFDTRENTLPSAASKTTRSQLRNYARDKSTSEETLIVKERSRRSQSLRKTSADLILDSDDAVLTPLKLDEEVVKNDKTRPFLKKCCHADFVAPSSITKNNISMTPKPQNNEEDNNDLTFEPEDMGNTVKGEEEEEFKSMSPKGHKDLDNGKPRLSLESEKLVNSRSENGDTMRSFTQVDQALGAELPAIVQDWTAESPLSWSTRPQHPFSYPHEMSDVDAFVDSPVGSPASWNSNCLSQIETDASRMRKKWGMAQKPMWAAHSSNNILRKDMTKGFKRLLKFGRKNRGSENLVDWISATTSEGDDDTEDGRDPSSRSSEDLRKSRMGFSQGQPSDESFTESEFFNEQVQSSHSSISAPAAYLKLREDHISVSSIKAPRSFFSLSTFRSKGSELRPKQHMRRNDIVGGHGGF